MGKVYDRMFMIGEKMKARTVTWKAQAEKIHASRWEYLHSPMHAAGYALDPEFMSTEGETDAATQEGLMTVIERLMLRDVIAAAEQPMDARKTIKMEDDTVQTCIADCMAQLSIYQSAQGIFTKPYVINNAKTMAPAECVPASPPRLRPPRLACVHELARLKAPHVPMVCVCVHRWWKMYGKHIPLVQSVAVRVLSQPICASAAERNWSVYGQIKTKERARMGHETGDMRVYCHEALHLEDKMQSAGAK
eukprot:1991594-Prymnesium_polylepis.1